jgi:hypothetical protein
MEMKRTTLFTLAVAFMFLAAGCSAITDFDKPKDAGPDGGGLYSIDTNLSSIVTVTLMGSSGELTLSLTNPLPQADDATLIGMLEDGTLGLNVANEETDVNFNLVEGQYSESISLPGDYNMGLNPERTSLTINFFNEIEGTTLHAGGDYMATIDVATNSYFVAEVFTRNVTVTGG